MTAVGNCKLTQFTVVKRTIADPDGCRPGIPDMIPAEACYLGWQESLTLLAKLVEVEIPD
jgi:hypothetical protein